MSDFLADCGVFGTISLGVAIFLVARESKKRRALARTAASLAEQKAVLETALNSMSQGLVMHGPDSRAIFLNRTYLEMYRLSPEQAKPGCTLHDLLELRAASGTFSGDVDAYVRSVEEPGQVLDKIIDDPDGRSIHVVNRVLEDGRRVCTHDDVTAQRRAERDLRASQEMLSWANRTLGVGIIQIDLTTGLITHSHQFDQIHGFAEGPYLESDLLALVRRHIHPKDLAAFEAHKAEIARGEPCEPIEFRFTRPDNSQDVWLREESDLLRDENGVPTTRIVTVRDITKERTVEKRQQELERQLFHSQKLESLGRLAGGIAHDLNNTLVPILTLSQFLLEFLPEDSLAHDGLATISAAAERARDLVRRILAFSRKQELRKGPTDLTALARETMQMLRVGIPAIVQFDSAIAEVPVIVGDAGQLQQVLVNLATNAVHAIGGNPGRITLTLEHLVRAEGDSVVFTVADTGCGMDEATKARAFEPFFTTKEVGDGTGLGLAVVHGIVEGHGGTISVDSTPGKGSTFVVTLPVNRPETSKEIPLPAAA